MILLIVVIIIILFIILSLSVLQKYKDPNSKDETEYHIPKYNQTQELVVAVCNENLNWIDDVAKNYNLVTVYNKCNNKISFISKNVKVINISNIGSCDYAYLTYIIDRYDTLPDFIEFTKGSIPGNQIYQKCNKCDVNNSLPIYSDLMNFSLKNWVFTNNPEMSKKSKFITSGHKNMKEWISSNSKDLDTSMYKKNSCNIVLGGHFGTLSTNIKKTPKSTYVNLRNMQKHQQEEVDHFIERTWGALLCKESYEGYDKNTIYVLTRTSTREKFFNISRASLENQTYKNWVHIISYDDDKALNYIKNLKKTKIYKVEKIEKIDKEHCPYNLYFNYLMSIVPKNSWIIFYDDDNIFFNESSLEILYKEILQCENTGKNLILLDTGTDTGHICIKKNKLIPYWKEICGGDKLFINDCINSNFEVYQKDIKITCPHWKGEGHGSQNDVF
jgi:hypothetical protein